MKIAMLLVSGLFMAGCCRGDPCVPDRQANQPAIVGDACSRQLAETMQSLEAAQRLIQTQQQRIVTLESVGPEAASSTPTDLTVRTETVSALRYRIWISDGGIRQPQIGHWAEGLWFPDWQLEAHIEPETYDGPPQLNVRRSEYPHAATKPGPVFIPAGDDPSQHYQGARETVQVPRELAQAMKATLDLQARLRKQREAMGLDVEKSGLIRKVKEGDTRSGQ